MPKVKQFVPEAEEKIKRLVGELGSITMEQGQLLLPEVDPDKYTFYVRYLYRNYHLDIVDNMVMVPVGKTNADYDTIDCLWAAIDNKDSFNLDTLFNAEDPAAFFYQLNNDGGDVQMYVRVRKNNASVVQAMQERYLARQMDDDGLFRYIFVVDSMDMLDVLSRYEIAIPNTVAVMDSSGLVRPENIKYFQG